MFQRVIYEDWHLVIAVVAFAVTATFFGAMIWRAVHMQRGRLDRLARMPLDDEPLNTDRHE